jgi:hypothetical protein
MQIKRLLLSLAVLLSSCRALVQEPAVPEHDPNLVLLLSDLHTGKKSSYQGEKLMALLDEVLAMKPLPAKALLMGDVAYLQGLEEDYQVLKPILQRLSDAGIEWRAAMGNHDRRENFWKYFPEQQTSPPLVPGRHVSIVETPHAEFILLDTLLEGKVEGELNDDQRNWLTAYLPTRKKPVFVCAHHPLKESKLGGLLAASPMVAAYIFGHWHHWQGRVTEGVNTLCLPSTGHWGDIGYVLVKLRADGADFSLQLRDHFKPRPLPEPKPEWIRRVDKLRGATWSVAFPTAAEAAEPAAE